MTQQGLSTTAVHAGSERPNPHHSLTVPVTQTATYTFADTQDLCDFMDARMWGMAKGRTEYGRYGNPTVAAAETKLAALEGAEAALLYSSGMAAVTSTILTLVNAGAHLIITDDSYRRTRQFCLNFLKKFNIESTVVPMGDFNALESAIRPETKLIISESPTNPYLRVLDLKQLADIAKAHNIKTLVDATFATPFNLRPLDFGIDLVIHSGTKYLGGHNDILAGVVAGSEQLIALLRQQLWMLGGVFDPHSAYLLLRGLKTLGLRVERQNQNGQRIAEFLEKHPKIDRVWYPGLKSHPDHEISKKQMKGFGGVISFEVKSDPSAGSGEALAAASKVVDGVRIPIIAPSLGGVETLIEQPALMSYYEMSTEERIAVGIKDNLIRLALGVEDTEDLINDLAQALE